uniref:Protein kinase domain-containing protein n=1 Tax=Timema bartmani TaxID=61472 RepID=A0A7R9EPM5_9NEOP|nr:unnamed protein product [Timema bartmani]
MGVGMRRGLFANVLRCRSRETGQQFAAKFSSRARYGEDCSAEIYHEIALLSLCAPSPRIVGLHDVFETPSEIIIVMELECPVEYLIIIILSLKVELSSLHSALGGDLQTIIDDNLVPFESDVLKFVRQLVEGLVYLHERKIAHLDIKIRTPTSPSRQTRLFEPDNLVRVPTVVGVRVGNNDYSVTRATAVKEMPSTTMKTKFGSSRTFISGGSWLHGAAPHRIFPGRMLSMFLNASDYTVRPTPQKCGAMLSRRFVRASVVWCGADSCSHLHLKTWIVFHRKNAVRCGAVRFRVAGVIILLSPKPFAA